MITITGGSKTQRNHAFSLAVHVCQKFNISPTVEINFRRMTNDAATGTCLELEHGEYEVDIKRSLCLLDMLTTLAHELVHVKQYMLLEMPQYSEEGEYWDRAHEIEAHGRERGLFINWAKANSLENKAWIRKNQ